MSKGKNIGRNIAFSFVPALLTYLSKSDNVFNFFQKNNYIGSNVNISLIKDICLVSSIVLTFLLLTYNLIKADIDKSNFCKQRDMLLELNKKIFVNALGTQLGSKYLNLDLRIFVPKITLLDRVNNIFKKNHKKEFVIRNIDCLANTGTTGGLKFEVYPNDQGLVGECYRSKSMIYDSDLKNTNSSIYKLKKDQINKTDDLRFCLCCPIFNTKEEIIAIVSFDSKQEILLSESCKDVLRDSVIVFAQSLHDYIPEIFKPKGGIL